MTILKHHNRNHVSRYLTTFLMACASIAMNANASGPAGETIPGTPMSPTLTNITSNSITVSWKAVSGATSYKL